MHNKIDYVIKLIHFISQIMEWKDEFSSVLAFGKIAIKGSKKVKKWITKNKKGSKSPRSFFKLF